MKTRKLAVMLILILGTVLVLTGCQKSQETPEPAVSSTPTDFSWGPPVSTYPELSSLTPIKLTASDDTWMYGQSSIWGDIAVGMELDSKDNYKAYITTYNLLTREKKRVWTPSRMMMPPSIYENKIVWSEVEGSSEVPANVFLRNWTVYLFDLDSGQLVPLTTDYCAQADPQIYGDTVIWLDNRNDTSARKDHFDIYAYDLKTREERRLTTTTSIDGEDGGLAISGNLVVWADSRNADPNNINHASNDASYNNDIYAYDLSTNREIRITTSPLNDHYPAVDGENIVWLREEGYPLIDKLSYEQGDIFSYNLTTGTETRVSHSHYVSTTPTISGNRIAWTDARVSQGHTSNDTVDVDSQGVAHYGAVDIYVYDIQSQRETQVTSASPVDNGGNWIIWWSPILSGDYLLYSQNRSIGSLVYYLRLPPEAAASNAPDPSLTPPASPLPAPLSTLAAESRELGSDWFFGRNSISGEIALGIKYEQINGATKQAFFTINLQTGEEKKVLELPYPSYVSFGPSISGDNAVWSSTDSLEYLGKVSPTPNRNVFLLDLKTGQVRQITTDEYDHTAPVISGDTIIWLDNRNSDPNVSPPRYDLYTYDLKTGQEKRITTDPSLEGQELAISGNLVVWSDCRNADPNISYVNNDIYVYDLSTKEERRITTSLLDDRFPAIDGDNIVWLREDGNLVTDVSSGPQADVFSFNLKTGIETRISNSHYAALNPGISGDYIAWVDARVSGGRTLGNTVDGPDGVVHHDGAEIYLYDLTTASEMRITSAYPEDNGGRWVVSRMPVLGGNYLIYGNTESYVVELPISGLPATPSSTSQVAGKAVTFSNANLDSAVRKTIHKPQGVLYTSDLATISTLDAEGLHITNLEGLQYCTDLNELLLSDNAISDIIPLKNLTGLRILKLGNNQIEDISALANLKSLLELDLSHNQLSDLYPLCNIRFLQYLELSFNKVNNLYPLAPPQASFVNIGYIGLANNEISDVSPLLFLRDLRMVLLQGNPLSDKSLNAFIPQLEERNPFFGKTQVMK